MRVVFSIENLGSNVLLNEDLSNLEAYIEKINDHKLRFNAASGTNPSGTILCKKLVAGELDNLYSARFTQIGKSAEIILPLLPKDPISTDFICKVSDARGKVLSEQKLTIAKNVVVRTKTTLPELHKQKIGILLLTPESEIITEGRDLSLQVGELISLSGAISTFDNHSVRLTSADTRGRDGGRIKLHTEKATGVLIVNLRGTNGGKQTFVAQRPPQAGRGADGTCHSRNNPRTCDGENGAPGLPAVDGKDGFPGGSTGSIELIVAEKSDFEAILNYEPGQGSEGVKASLPGLGGDPGRTGSIHHQSPNCGRRNSPLADLSNCLVIISGKDGQHGSLGPYGVDGLPGNPGEYETSRFINVYESQDEYVRGSWSNLKGYL